MYWTIVSRLMATIPVMAMVAVFIFLLLHLAPGDPAAILAGDQASPRDIERIRESLGLDQPLHLQFFAWVAAVLQGDLGTSIFSRKPVIDLVLQRVEPTIALTLSTLIVTISVAIPMGTIAARRQGGWIDRTVMGFSTLGFSIPAFVGAYGLIWVFSIQLGWFPVQGYSSISNGFGAFLHSIFLPTLTLSFVYIALLARMTRASVIDVLGEDHVRTAKAKGLAERKIVLRHVLRNAAVPIATVVGISIALLIGGVVVTESVYNIPGMGRLVADSILRRDYPVIQGLMLIFALVYVGVNLIIDILYVILDPRIRL